jgi:hypothetical protein
VDTDVDVGLGTAYERVAIYRVLDEWFAGKPIATAFEGPLDNMAGIPGLHLIGLAQRGARVTVALGDARALSNVEGVYATRGLRDRLETRLLAPSDALAERAYDVALSYNVLPLVPDWRSFLARVARTSKRWLVVALTNPRTYGASVRRLLRPFESRPQEELFQHESVLPAHIEPELAKLGRIAGHEYFDCPWWPDLFVDAGDSLLSATMRRLPFVSRFAPPPQKTTNDAAGSFVYGRDDYPYPAPLESNRELAAALRKHPTFDHVRGVAPYFAHLHAYLVELPAQQ